MLRTLQLSSTAKEKTSQLSIVYQHLLFATYLLSNILISRVKLYLADAAAKAVSGLTLTDRNYDEAIKLLQIWKE